MEVVFAAGSAYRSSMIVERFPEIAELSLEEKKRLMNELWDEISRSYLERPDPAIVELLDERWRHYEENPETVMSVEEFRRRIGGA